jgi:hypothetical protein
MDRAPPFTGVVPPFTGTAMSVRRKSLSCGAPLADDARPNPGPCRVVDRLQVQEEEWLAE